MENDIEAERHIVESDYSLNWMREVQEKKIVQQATEISELIKLRAYDFVVEYH